MKKWILIFVLCIAAFSAPAWEIDLTEELIPRTELALALPIKPSDFPNSDQVLAADYTLVEYAEDGTYALVSDSALKILTEKGRREESIVSLGYDAAYGSKKFVYAEVIKRDGRIIPVDLERQASEMINPGQMGANIYNPNQRKVQLTVPDLEIGDIVRYRYTAEYHKTIVPGTFSDYIVFEEQFPILHSVYQISGPAALPLINIELRDEISGTVTHRETRRAEHIRHRWEARNIPRMFDEPKMPQRHTVVQRLLLSTIPDWESLSMWYWDLSKPRIETVNSNMASKVEELTAGLTNDLEKTEAIFRFVSQDIRYMGITIEDEAPGYEPHDVSLTFDNRYGVCRDKAALLAAMLRLADMEAFPVLIYVGPKKDPGVPQPWFNHAVTAVRRPGGSWLLMDSTDENTKDIFPAYLANRSYLAACPEGETLRVSNIIPAREQLLSIETDAALNTAGTIEAQSTLRFSGINDTAYRGRLSRLKPEERRPYFEERLKQAVGAAKLTKLEIEPADVRDTTQPLTVHLRWEAANALTGNGGTQLLKPPTLVNAFGLFGRVLGNGVSLVKRKYPLHTGITCGVDEVARLDISAPGLSVAALPGYEPVETPEFSVTRSISESGGVIESHATIYLNAVEFDPGQYAALKAALKETEYNARKQILFSPPAFDPEASVAVLDETVEYFFADADHWKKTRTVRKKILNYTGKKEHAELKMPYNPAQEQVTLNYARVTAPDGTVRKINNNEINVMDAPWVAKAPRYPPGKILVASFPGVEIGSILEYQVTSIYHGLPFFSSVETFGDLHPVQHKTVRLSVPYKMKFDFNPAPPGVRFFISSTEHGHAVYNWESSNLPMIKKEDRLPPRWLLAPSVFISNGNLEKYARRVEKALLRAAGKSKAARAKAKALGKKLESSKEKIEAVRDLVDRSVKLAGPKLYETPLASLTPADETLASGYGSSADRAALLYAMLDALKLKPRFILASGLPPGATADPVYAFLQQNGFAPVLVAIDLDDEKTVYLGDTGQYAHLGTTWHNRRPAIDLDGKTRIQIEAGEPDARLTRFAISLSEAPDTESVNGDVYIDKQEIYTGVPFERFNKLFAELSDEERQREHQKMVSALSQAAEPTTGLTTDLDRGLCAFRVRIPRFAVLNGEYLYLTLPEGLRNILRLKSEERDSELYLPNAFHRAFVYEITLPDGWAVEAAPEPLRRELPGGAGFVEVGIQQIENRLMIMQRIELEPAFIPVEEYSKLSALHNRLNHPSARTILLKKKEAL